MKYLKTYKIFESLIINNIDEYICARSSDWVLCAFNDYVSYLNFENVVSPDGPLTRGPFSAGKKDYYNMINGINYQESEDMFKNKKSMFDQYLKRYGTLYTLLSINCQVRTFISSDISPEQDVYQFNCNGKDFYGIFTTNLNHIRISDYSKYIKIQATPDSKADERISLSPFNGWKVIDVYKFFDNILTKELDYTNGEDENNVISSFKNL